MYAVTHVSFCLFSGTDAAFRLILQSLYYTVRYSFCIFALCHLLQPVDTGAVILRVLLFLPAAVLVIYMRWVRVLLFLDGYLLPHPVVRSSGSSAVLPRTRLLGPPAALLAPPPSLPRTLPLPAIMILVCAAVAVCCAAVIAVAFAFHRQAGTT